MAHVGGYQTCGPFWGNLNIRCRIIVGTQKGTIILTATHVEPTIWPACWTKPRMITRRPGLRPWAAAAEADGDEEP